jgi:hypothetical protein
MKTFKQWILIKEAARWKSTGWKRPHSDTLLRLKKYNRLGYYCHFTDIANKIGINPQSEHGTPPGIYAYTVKYVLENQLIKLPWASDKKYIWIFRAKNSRKVQKINNKNDEVAMLWKELTMLNMKRKMDSKSRKEQISRISNFFLRQGIEGIVDNGTATIHIHEPFQVVFFGSQTIIPVDFFENKLAKEALNYQNSLFSDDPEPEPEPEEEEEEEEEDDDDEDYFNYEYDPEYPSEFDDEPMRTAYDKSPWD